jgi:hypothetical protein
MRTSQGASTLHTATAQADRVNVKLAFLAATHAHQRGAGTQRAGIAGGKRVTKACGARAVRRRTAGAAEIINLRAKRSL